MPVYTNANRPAGNLGDLIFNSTETVQIYNGTEWQLLLKQYLKYLAEHSLVLVDIRPHLYWCGYHKSLARAIIEYLIVGGGGGGGMDMGGGGGGGGRLWIHNNPRRNLSYSSRWWSRCSCWSLVTVNHLVTSLVLVPQQVKILNSMASLPKAVVLEVVLITDTHQNQHGGNGGCGGASGYSDGGFRGGGLVQHYKVSKVVEVVLSIILAVAEVQQHKVLTPLVHQMVVTELAVLLLALLTTGVAAAEEPAYSANVGGNGGNGGGGGGAVGTTYGGSVSTWSYQVVEDHQELGTKTRRRWWY